MLRRVTDGGAVFDDVHSKLLRSCLEIFFHVGTSKLCMLQHPMPANTPVYALFPRPARHKTGRSCSPHRHIMKVRSAKQKCAPRAFCRIVTGAKMCYDGRESNLGGASMQTQKLHYKGLIKEILILTVAVTIIAAAIFFFLVPSHTRCV